MTNNRTNEVTPEQVEAAAKVLLRDYQSEYDGGEVSEFLDVARAALVAAQGAAPQAAKDIHEPNHDRVYCVRCGGNWPCQPAPVLPSGVDEEALAEVVDKALIRHGEMAGMSNQERWDARDDIARAVAEWLEGQGR